MRVKMSRQRHMKGSFFFFSPKLQLKLNFLTITVLFRHFHPNGAFGLFFFFVNVKASRATMEVAAIGAIKYFGDH